MSVDFREKAGGRSGETEGLLERQVTLGKTRFEALRASNPLASKPKTLLKQIKKDAPMIHRKGERMMDQSVTLRLRLDTPNGLRDQTSKINWKWTTHVYVAEDLPLKEG